MKHYEFNILLNGCGDTPDEAWQEAVEGFTMDPGCISEDEITFIEELDEDGNEFETRKILKDTKSKLLQACKCALADLEGIMPEFEPSGDRTHPAWHTIDELKVAIGILEGG